MRKTILSRILLLAAIVFVLDRVSKVWVVEKLNLREELWLPVVKPWISFRMAWNRGINFGFFNMGENGRWVLITVASAIVVGVLIWAQRDRGWARIWGAGLVVGGALGNVWDRLQYGAVADFLNVTCCGINNPYAFNVADAAIFLGAAILVFFVPEKSKPRPRRKNAKSS